MIFSEHHAAFILKLSDSLSSAGTLFNIFCVRSFVLLTIKNRSTAAMASLRQTLMRLSPAARTAPARAFSDHSTSVFHTSLHVFVGINVYVCIQGETVVRIPFIQL